MLRPKLLKYSFWCTLMAGMYLRADTGIRHTPFIGTEKGTGGKVGRTALPVGDVCVAQSSISFNLCTSTY